MCEAFRNSFIILEKEILCSDDQNMFVSLIGSRIPHVHQSFNDS